MDPPDSEKANPSNAHPMDIPEPEIQEQDYPSELGGGQYDGLVICSKSARNIANNFKEVVETRVRMDDGTAPKVALLGFDRNGDFRSIGSRYVTLDEAIKRSTYYFFIMTPDFETDCWNRISKEECLMESIASKDKTWSVIPLTTTEEECDFRLPIGLRSLRPLCISALFNGRNITEDLGSFIRGITELFNARKQQRQTREREQQKRCEAWRKRKIEQDKRPPAIIRSLQNEQSQLFWTVRKEQSDSERASHVSRGMADMNISQQPSPGTVEASGGVLTISRLHVDGAGLTINLHCDQAQVGSNNIMNVSHQNPPEVDQNQAAGREDDSVQYMVCDTPPPVEESSTQDGNTPPGSR